MDPRTRLGDALKLREELSARHQRFLGRAEEAEQAYAEVCRECRERGVDPESIDEAIAQVNAALESQLSAFEADLARVAAELDALNRKT